MLFKFQLNKACLKNVITAPLTLHWLAANLASKHQTKVTIRVCDIIEKREKKYQGQLFDVEGHDFINLCVRFSLGI